MKTLGKEEVASVKVIQQWEKPWRDKLKFNCDGTFNRLTGDGGWGFIIRDHDGDMVSFAKKDKIMRVIDAFQAKAVACRHGVNWAMEIGIGHIVLEFDSLMLTREIQSHKYDKAISGGIITEIKNITTGKQGIFLKFFYIPRYRGI
jgi:ribonuclease HI